MGHLKIILSSHILFHNEIIIKLKRNLINWHSSKNFLLTQRGFCNLIHSRGGSLPGVVGGSVTFWFEDMVVGGD